MKKILLTATMLAIFAATGYPQQQTRSRNARQQTGHFEIQEFPRFFPMVTHIDKPPQDIVSISANDWFANGVGQYVPFPQALTKLIWSPKKDETYIVPGKVFIGIRKNSPSQYDVAFVVDSINDVPAAVLARKPFYTELNKDSVFLAPTFPKASNIVWLCKFTVKNGGKTASLTDW